MTTSHDEDNQATLNQLEEVFDALGCAHERIGDLLNLQRGEGRLARKANIDPQPLLQTLRELENPARRQRSIAGFAKGASDALREPKRSKASQWDFPTAAARIQPSAEAPSYVLGFQAANHSEPLTTPYLDGLLLAYHLILDGGGIRVVDHPQLQRWNTGAQRVANAASSLLYHRSESLYPRPLPEHDGVQMIRAADGFDAARLTLLDDLFYDRDASRWRLSIPEHNYLLFVEQDDTTSLEALTHATLSIFANSPTPLSQTIFKFSATGQPLPLDSSRGEGVSA